METIDILHLSTGMFGLLFLSCAVTSSYMFELNHDEIIWHKSIWYKAVNGIIFTTALLSFIMMLILIDFIISNN